LTSLFVLKEDRTTTRSLQPLVPAARPAIRWAKELDHISFQLAEKMRDFSEQMAAEMQRS